jgi:hypothetical protein
MRTLVLTLWAALALPLILTGAAGPAESASLLGDSVDMEFINYGTDGSGPLGTHLYSAVVGPTVEFPVGPNIDLDATSITLSAGALYGPNEFDTYTLSDLDFDTGEVIVDVSLIISNVVGL